MLSFRWMQLNQSPSSGIELRTLCCSRGLCLSHAGVSSVIGHLILNSRSYRPKPIRFRACYLFFHVPFEIFVIYDVSTRVKLLPMCRHKGRFVLCFPVVSIQCFHHQPWLTKQNRTKRDKRWVGGRKVIRDDDVEDDTFKHVVCFQMSSGSD